MNIKNLNLTQQQAEKHAIFKPFADEKLVGHFYSRCRPDIGTAGLSIGTFETNKAIMERKLV
jgi:hypothetical protein